MKIIPYIFTALLITGLFEYPKLALFGLSILSGIVGLFVFAQCARYFIQEIKDHGDNSI
jgi:hypothetical protein